MYLHTFIIMVKEQSDAAKVIMIYVNSNGWKYWNRNGIAITALPSFKTFKTSLTGI